jgi:hypothetical protein
VIRSALWLRADTCLILSGPHEFIISDSYSTISIYLTNAPPPLAPIWLPVIHPLSGRQTTPTIPATSSKYPGLPPMLAASSTISGLSTPFLAAARGMSALRGFSASLGASGRLFKRPVSIGPGDTALTVQRSASSRAQTRVMASIAPLVPAYDVCWINPHVVVAEEMFTILPERSWGK